MRSFFFVFFHLRLVAKGAKTWGPSTYHQRERGSLVEFPAQTTSPGEPPSFSKSAPNLDKSKPPFSSMSPLPPRLQRGIGTSSATSLGKSHDEGLNKIKGKKMPTYNRGHTTNLCLDVASSSSSSPFKITLGDSAGFNSGSGGLLMRRAPDATPNTSSSTIGCFGRIRGGVDSSEVSPDGGRFNSSSRHHKKFSLDNSRNSSNSAKEGEERREDVTYDSNFYRRMQQSVEYLFDKSQFSEDNLKSNSKSSGDLVNSDESFSESTGSSEFRRECFFNKSATAHEPPQSVKGKSRSGSLPKGGVEKIQYLSLNDLLGNGTQTAGVSGSATETCKDWSGQYSHSSTSSHTTASTSSRKNSQVSFDEGGGKGVTVGSKIKLPPMKSEVSPRKFEKIYNLGTMDQGPVLGAVKSLAKSGTTQKRGKGGFIASLLKKGQRSVEKHTAKRGDEKVNLVTDENDDDLDSQSRIEIVGGDARPMGRQTMDESTTYDMIYTKRHIIAKQSADHA